MLAKYILSIALGTIMVWLAFRNEDWGAFERNLRDVDTGPIMAYIAIFLTAHLLRIVRWGVLVRALGPVPWSKVMGVGAVGYMCIMVFPLRLGEFVRPYLIRTQGGVTASGALATVIVERVIDGILFVGLFFIFISLLPESGHPAVGMVKVGAYIAGLVFVGTLIVLLLAYRQRERTVAILSCLGRKIHTGLADRCVGLLESFLDGLKVLPDKRRLGLFMVFTTVYWTALGVGMQWVAQGVHIDDLSLTGSFALLTVLTVGIMVPAGPGFAGTFELALKAGFALLVLSPSSVEKIVVYTVVLHICQLAVQVGVGALWLFTGRVDLSALKTGHSGNGGPGPSE